MNAWDGLTDLQDWLRGLPAELTADADLIVSAAANDAADAIRSAYPTVSGDLKGGVRVVVTAAGEFHAESTVRSTSVHARYYESGTQTRQTALGYNRGRMPPAHTVGKTAPYYRRRMVDQLNAMVREAGLIVG